MKTMLLGLVVAGLGFAFAGCNNQGEKPMSNDEIRSSMVSDLATTYETEEEVKNRFTHTSIINGRKINADLMRLFLLDHPSRDVSSPTIQEYE